MTKADRYKSLINFIGIDERYTKKIKNVKYDKIRGIIYPKQDYNQMADILFLPTTDKGYKYMLTLVDLWSDEVDFEPLKSKKSDEVLEALKTIYKRKYLDKPYGTLRTDQGTEFKGVFQKWLYDENVYHSVSLPDRHKQMGKIENVNRLLGRLVMGYINKMSMEKNEVNTNWDNKAFLNLLRVKLNKIRKIEDEDPYEYNYATVNMTEFPKFKIGDVVIRKLETPKDVFTNNRQNTKNFRQGDLRWDIYEPKKILKVLYYPNNYRYVLEGFPQVSYTEQELIKSNNKESKFAIKEIIGKKTIKGKINYLVWWKGYKKKESTWEPKENLIEDGAKSIIDNFEKIR